MSVCFNNNLCVCVLVPAYLKVSTSLNSLQINFISGKMFTSCMQTLQDHTLMAVW